MSRFYNTKGELIDRVPTKKGTVRDTNIRDARKGGLLPSNTTLLKIFDKPAVDIWRVSEAIKSCVDNPKLPGEPTDEYVSRIVKASGEKSSTAKDFGTIMHFRIECYLKRKDIPLDDVIKEYWPHVQVFINEAGMAGESEKVVVDSKLGFAGTLDFIGKFNSMPKTLVDFKTQGTLDSSGKPKKIVYYDEWAYQLGGYRLAYNKAHCVSVVISSDEPGRIEYKVWDEDVIQRSEAIFTHLCKVYSLAKNLPFSWWSEEL